jgi:hypothetical protein
MIEVKFITHDEETDGIAVEHDGREVWADGPHDSWDQYFRRYMPRGVPVLLSQDTRPSEREGQARDDPRPYPQGEGTDARLARWLVDNTSAYGIRFAEEDEEGRPTEVVGPVIMDGSALMELLTNVAERMYWHGVDDVRATHGLQR